jgi:APA family basic amino acid/polyamine antiporter
MSGRLNNFSLFAYQLRALESPAMVATDASQVDRQLERAIGVPGLTANIINTTIGASIFVVPATMARNLGSAAPIAFVLCALAMIVFVTCFAIAGSRVALTGGPYAYIEVAFGRYVGFLAGVIYFVMALLSAAAITSVLVGAIVTIVPQLDAQVLRAVLTFLIYACLALLNVRGVRNGTRAVAITTAAKLVPLFIFIVAGFFFIKPASLTLGAWPDAKLLGDSVLFLLFAFFGIEIALVPSGEVRNPARTVPRAIYIALVTITIVYILVQLVAQGTLGPRLAQSTPAPLAEAAVTFLGQFGRFMLLAAATISSFGFLTSNVLSSPRILFALGRDGILPGAFAHVHARFRSPDVAIFTYSAVAFVFSLTSTFESLVIMANVSALLLYALCCAASWELMRRNVRTEAPPFNFPGAQIVPVISIVLIIWLLMHATKREWLVTATVLAAASILYGLRRATSR